MMIWHAGASVAGGTMITWTSGASTTASMTPLSAPPPPVTEVAATATVTLVMMAAQVSELKSILYFIQYICFFLVSPDADLTCWAINGWVDQEDKDQWCIDNCLHNPPNCPSTTGDGGGCLCNCNAGDDGCPCESTIINMLYFWVIYFLH